jgi:hypothetical protein
MNMEGETSINSNYGAFVTLLSLIVIFVYALVRIDALQSMRDTVRSDITVADWIDESTLFNFNEEGF